MRPIAKAVAIIALIGFSVSDGLACSTPPKTRPTITERISEGGNYVMAVVESPDRYLNRGYQPTAEDQALLEKYPVSGVYRVGGSSEQPVWPLGNLLGARWFFEEGDSVYWIETSVKPFRVWKDGELMGGPDWKNAVEWFRSPWTWRDQCGGYSLYKLEMTSGDSGRVVRIRTGEGTEFLYSATTGEEIEANVPQPLPPQPATGGENQIAQILARWSQFAEASAYEDLSSDFAKHNAEIVVESCAYLEAAFDDLGGPDWMVRQGLFPAGPGIQATRTYIYSASRLLHELDGQVDLYLIPAGKAAQTLCLEKFDFRDEPPFELENEHGIDVAQQMLGALHQRLDGPTVLASTTWPVPEDSDFAEEEEIGQLGSATLWSETDEGWRIVAFIKFVLPKD